MGCREVNASGDHHHRAVSRNPNLIGERIGS
jgi:hypothetical protein